MADYGLEIYNNDNALVIDQTYRNMVFRNKVTVTATKNAPAVVVNNIAEYRTPVSTFSDALIAVRTTNVADRSKPISLRRYRGEWLISVYAPGTSAVSIAVDIYVFGYKDSEFSNSDTNYGLLVYDAQGKLTFDSGKKYIKVLGYFYANLFDQMANGTGDLGTVASQQVSILQDYAYMPVSSAYHDELFAYDDEDEWYGNRWVKDCFFSLAGGAAKIDILQCLNIPLRGRVSGMPSLFSYTSPLLTAFVIDVTNY